MTFLDTFSAPRLVTCGCEECGLPNFRLRGSSDSLRGSSDANQFQNEVIPAETIENDERTFICACE